MPNEATDPADHAVPQEINALGMKCPWPVLRAARAMRTADAVLIAADDPIAGSELATLASERGWTFAAIAQTRFMLARRSGDRA